MFVKMKKEICYLKSISFNRANKKILQSTVVEISGVLIEVFLVFVEDIDWFRYNIISGSSSTCLLDNN